MERLVQNWGHKCEESLDVGQNFALNAFRDGHSVALLGGAGSGKSFFLKTLIQEAQRIHGGFPSVTACALSNKAAEALNGITIHRLFAAKPSWEFSKEYLLENLKGKPGLCEKLREIKVLIIDEISLLTSNILDSVDHVFRELSESEWHYSLPLGGRQLIIAFDPFQLEPHPEETFVQRDSLLFSYESRLWYLTFGPPGDGVVVVLDTNHRQSTDLHFFEILSRIRIGKHTTEDINTLNSTGKKMLVHSDTYTRLCLTNQQAREINERKLALIPNSVIRSSAVDSFYVSGSSDWIASLHRRLANVAPQQLTFKIGSHVILIRKVDDILPGTHGVVRSVKMLTARRGEPQYEMGLGVFPGLSGGREGLSADVTSSRKVIKVRTAKFDIHSFDCKVIARREQLPLIPAYAVTVHRSQGMTLSHVAIDFELAKVWKPNGMAYVALSRCTSISGLWIRGLNKEVITVSNKAKKFMKELRKQHFYMPERIWGAQSLPVFGEDSRESPESRQEVRKTSEQIPNSVFSVVDGKKICSAPCTIESSTLKKKYMVSKRRFEYRAILKGRRACLRDHKGKSNIRKSVN